MYMVYLDNIKNSFPFIIISVIDNAKKILICPHLSLKDISNNFLINFPFLFVDFISIQKPNIDT